MLQDALVVTLWICYGILYIILSLLFYNAYTYSPHTQFQCIHTLFYNRGQALDDVSALELP